MKETENIIIRYYEYFYQKITRNPSFEFLLNSKDQKTLWNFFILLNKKGFILSSLGEEFWFGYFSFQFEYWRDKKTRLGQGKTYFSWVIGPTALDRWLKRNKSWNYFCKVGILTKYNIKKSDLINRKKLKKSYLKINLKEETEKLLYYNIPLGLQHCMGYTTLFNQNSQLCKDCQYKDLCFVVLKDLYPKIYKERNNGKM